METATVASTEARQKARVVGVPTLAQVVENLGVGVVQVVVAPAGLDVAVLEAFIDDPTGPCRCEEGDLVLAVGTRPDSPRALELVRAACGRTASAVAFKISGPAPDWLVDGASSSGIALLAVPEEIAWGQLHTLFRTALASGGLVTAPAAVGIPLGDLFALANAVAAMTGGSVTIEDPQSRVLAYSSLAQPIDEARRQTILGRRVPQKWIRRLEEAGVFRSLRSSHEVIRFQSDNPKDLRPRLAVAVRAGEEFLGSIWMLEGSGQAGPEAETALREGARIAALHLIRHRATDDIERRTRGELVRSLLEGTGSADLVAARLGIKPVGPVTVIAFELQDSGDAEATLKADRMLELVSIYCEAFGRRAAAASVGGVVYVLLPTESSEGRPPALKFARDIVEKASASARLRLHVGVGPTVSHLREAARSRALADQVLRVLAVDPKGTKVADVDAVRERMLLLELGDLVRNLPHLREGKVGRLATHDAMHGTFYVETLRAYLEAFGDVLAAAAQVRVHPNTFRYRLHRLAQLSSFDLNDPDDRLAAQLQLRLW